MSDAKASFVEIQEVLTARAAAGESYREFLRMPSMSAGVYVLAAGAEDKQSPHRQDELYYVVRGRARMRVGSLDREVGEGSLIFVAAAVEHRFYEIREELQVLVFFAPAETA